MAFGFAIVSAACGSSEAEPAETFVEPTELLATELTTDLVYHPTEEPFSKDSGLVDVVAPTEGGPWPTVVVFHGDPRMAGKRWHRSDATLIAEQGRVVFLPAWGDTPTPDDAGEYAEFAGLAVREAQCALVFAASNTAGFGGDPEQIAVYGLSAGASILMMAGLAEPDPLDNCLADGPVPEVQALVAIDADWLIGGRGDQHFMEDPDVFYAVTPWRLLDGSPHVAIVVMVAEIGGPSYERPVGPKPDQGWLSYRHPDIDLLAVLDEGGYVDDDSLSLRESGEYAHQVFVDAGYDATLVVIPEASHESWGEAGTAVIVDTVLDASRPCGCVTEDSTLRTR